MKYALNLLDERLFQYIWQHQLFSLEALTSTAGDEIRVIQPGLYNRDQGPDFLNARILYKGSMLVGHIELHLRSSDWHRHGHSNDLHYKNTILHVVMDHDILNEPDNIPVLELSGRVSTSMLHRYHSLMKIDSDLPCAQQFVLPSPLIWQQFCDRLFYERMLEKLVPIGLIMNSCGDNWKEGLWRTVARSFGGSVNGDSFLRLAESLPLKVVEKHRSMIIHLEALMFGQANLIQHPTEDDYIRLLQREYGHLKKKYRLQIGGMPFKFLRMRPRNFPTVRIAQLAALMQSVSISHFLDTSLQYKALVKELEKVKANDYWSYHYRVGEKSAFEEKYLGGAQIDSLFINAVLPFQFYKAGVLGDSLQQEKVIEYYHQIPQESNQITKTFDRLGYATKNAYETQMLLRLHKHYCCQKRCLECAVGIALVRQ